MSGSPSLEPQNSGIALKTQVAITDIGAHPLRFKLEKQFGADARNTSPGYGNVAVTIETDGGIKGCGLTFHLSNPDGEFENCDALDQIATLALDIAEVVIGPERQFPSINSIFADIAGFHKALRDVPNVSWGGDSGLYQMALTAISNSVFDLAAKVEEKSLGQWLEERSVDELLSMLDLDSLDGYMTREQARVVLEDGLEGRAERAAEIRETGIRRYLTAGWGNQNLDTLKDLIREAKDEQFQAVKIKVGYGFEQDCERVRAARDAAGPDMTIMVDANKSLTHDEILRFIPVLAENNIYWFEEPSVSEYGATPSRKLREEFSKFNLKLATGETIPRFADALELEANDGWDVCQCDNARLTIPQHLALRIYAAHTYKQRVEENLGSSEGVRPQTMFCPHAGGTGLNSGGFQVSGGFYVLGIEATAPGEQWLEFIDPEGINNDFMPLVAPLGGYYTFPSILRGFVDYIKLRMA